jgi:hypothetical protein
MYRSRFGVLTASVAVAAAIALAGCAARLEPAGAGATSSVTPITSPGVTSARPCAGDALTLDHGVGISPMTGEHPFDVAITNRGSAACSLIGYPAVALLDAAGRVLPFSYRNGGGYVTAATPTQVWLAPSQQAAVLIANYRCDLGDKDVATSAEFRFPGIDRIFTIQAGADWPIEEYCGSDDPGNEIDVSPIAPDIETAAAIGLLPLPTPPASELSPPSAK